jgi:hypothetical protein
MRGLSLHVSAPVRSSLPDRIERDEKAADQRRLRSHQKSVERAVAMVAVRFVRTWGFTTVGMVSQRFRLTTTPNESRLAMARRALALLPDLRWLNPAREWFTLLESDSPTKAAFAKIVAITEGVDRRELVLALGKHHSFGDAPEDVVHAYLDELVSSHERSRAWAAGATNASVPTREEQMLIDSLRDTGGSADITVLRRDAQRGSISAEALTRTLSHSPLFVRVSRGTYRLIGDCFPVEPRPLLS